MRKILVTEVGGPEAMQLVEVDDPTPGEGEIVVASRAIAVGWPDVLVRTGTYRWMPPLPVTPGNEMAGVVQAVGPGVEGFAVGDKVYVASRELEFRGGCYAEQMKVPAGAVQPLPDSVDFEAAAWLGYYSLAWVLLNDCVGSFQRRTAVVIGAAGGVGSALVQVAKAQGIRVIGTVSTAEKADYARACGADEVINYRSEDVVERVLALTDGEGVDVLLDPIVGPDFAEKFRMMAKWGTVVCYNARGGTPEGDWFAAWQAHAARCIGLRYFSMHVYEQDAAGRRGILEPVLELLAAGQLKPPPSPHFRLDQAVEAHRYLESGQNLGRILLTP